MLKRITNRNSTGEKTMKAIFIAAVLALALSVPTYAGEILIQA
jgi:hypothetical protein